MIKHKYTESSEINFSKLEKRIMAINDPKLNKAKGIREMLYELELTKKPTLLVATGGSKVVAYYLQLIIERMSLNGIICEVIEPRDYFYKANKSNFSNLIAISNSGNSNGIKEILEDFKGNKFLICEDEKEANYQVISWDNELYDKEKSFISLASSLGPITLMLDATTSLTTELIDREVVQINEDIKKILNMSISTKCASHALESNLTEIGLCGVVTHDKGSFCHGRNNLLFRYPSSHLIYLCHQKTELDDVLIDTVANSYSNISIFETSDLDKNYFWKEYYLLLQMYYLSKKIADDKQIDLTQPEYNPDVVKKLYKYNGGM